jgi:hypothetical protein
MSNTYGLDFLRREHTLNEEGQPQTSDTPPRVVSSAAAWADGDALAASVAHKPDLEKQFDVIHFLQAHRASGCLAPSVIYQKTGIDLQDNEAVAGMLKHNTKIRVEQVPDPENPSLMIASYAYQAKYNNIRDQSSLLAQINRCKNGVARRDLEDAYDGVETDLEALITAGDVVAIVNSEDKDKIIFPRGEPFLIELDGIINVPVVDSKDTLAVNDTTNGSPPKHNKTNGTTNGGIKLENEVEESPAADHKPIQRSVFCLETDIDPRSQIRRGEAVQVGGQWFRVSSAVKEGPLKDQPARAQAPLSVVSLTDLSKRNEQDGYIRPLSEKVLPLDDKLAKKGLDNLKNAKEAREILHKVAHGRSGGVASQLLGSHAHASNPTTLAASFGTASAGSRKRPNKSSAMSNAHKQDVETAQQAASNTAMSLYSHARRHGCTNDVREVRFTRFICNFFSLTLMKTLVHLNIICCPPKDVFGNSQGDSRIRSRTAQVVIGTQTFRTW